MELERKKLAMVLLMVVVLQLLLFPAAEAKPWWSRRRRGVKKPLAPASGAAWYGNHQEFSFICPYSKHWILQYLCHLPAFSSISSAGI